MPNETFTEKVSVNINSSTLSNIDLLVDNGYYSNRSDFINQALRNTLQQHQSTLDRIIEKNETGATTENPWFLGICGLTSAELNQMHEKGKPVTYRGYGILIIEEDCDEEKLFSIIKDIKVKGKVFCSEAIKKHYSLK